MKKYEHIFFDLDNTLWDFTESSINSLKQIFEKYNLKEKFETFENFYKQYEKLNSKLWKLYRENNISKETLSVRRFALVNEAVDNPKYTPDYFNREYLANTTQNIKLIDGAIDLLLYLSKKYKIHVITDGFLEVQIIKMQVTKINSFISEVIAAEDLGVLKPDKRLFEYALKQAEARKENSLVVGDDYPNDIIGAKKAGIDQIFFNRKKLTDLPEQPTFIVENLPDIKKIL